MKNKDEIIDTTGYRMPLNLFEIKRLFRCVQLQYCFYKDDIEYVLILKDGRKFYIDEELFNILNDWEKQDE